MLKIGDFSRLSQVSVDTLRHYDTLGLLKPSEVDPLTGYRYYTYHQLGRLNRILALKDLGLALEQIAPLLEGEISAEQIKGMLKLKRAEIEQRLDTEQERLGRVEARLNQIEMESKLPNYEVVIKNIKPQLVASIRRVLPTADQIIPLYTELAGHLAKHSLVQSRAITIWRGDGWREQDVDIEAAIALKTRIPETGAMKVYELPAATVASVVHNGAFNRLYEAYKALNAWIDASSYRSSDSARELYHYYEEPLRDDDETYVTEIQIPIEKA